MRRWYPNGVPVITVWEFIINIYIIIYTDSKRPVRRSLQTSKVFTCHFKVTGLRTLQSHDSKRPVRMSQRWCCWRTPPPRSRHCRRPWRSLCGAGGRWSLCVPAHVADTISRHALGRLWVGPISAQTAAPLTVVVHAQIAR